MHLKGVRRLIRHYFRTTIMGAENIPRSGPMLVVANHSGFAGADALVLADILQELGLSTRILAHWTYFAFPKIAKLSKKLGLRQTSIKSAVALLKMGHTVILFPEGETGNFKAFPYRYQLQEFHTGLVCIASQAKVPIVPVAIIGAEESHITLKSIKISGLKRDLRLPLPINIFPLPAKWFVSFGEPIFLSKKKTPLSSKEVYKSTWLAQNRIQTLLFQVLKSRPYVFSPKIDEFCRKTRFLSKVVSPLSGI